MTNNVTRVVIADDHGVVREGLKLLIDSQSDLSVVGDAIDGAVAFEMIDRLKPDVAIIDVSMPQLNGVELVAKLNEAGCQSQVLALTANEDRGYLHQLLKMGVKGYLLKRSAADMLLSAIRAVASGIRFVDPHVVDAMLEDNVANPSPNQPSTDGALSEREEIVLKMISEGYSNKEIAAKLDLSVKTIETYKARSMHKLSLRSRTDIVRYAVTRGWLRQS